MKIQKIIAIAFLALYGLVLLHNFVPHHHHSLSEGQVNHCYHDEDHHHSACERLKAEYNHQNKTHIHCSFEEVIVLRSKINIAELYSVTASNELILPIEEEQALTDNYILPHLQEARCRDVQLRGPPCFS